MKMTFEEFKAKRELDLEKLSKRVLNMIEKLNLKSIDFSLDQILPESIELNSKEYGRWETALRKLKDDNILKIVDYNRNIYKF